MSKTKIYEKEFWSDKTMDLANLQVVILVFGQLTSSKINLIGALFGSIIYLIAIIITLKIRNKDGYIK